MLSIMSAELLLAVPVEPEYLQIKMSATEPDLEPSGWPTWDDTSRAVSGTQCILVATWSDDMDPVAVEVYRGRPRLDDHWTHVHTAHLVVGDHGVEVGMTVSDVQHFVDLPPGETTVEVWVRPADSPSEVIFVLPA
jgi:hypothetical protein